MSYRTAVVQVPAAVPGPAREVGRRHPRVGSPKQARYLAAPRMTRKTSAIAKQGRGLSRHRPGTGTASADDLHASPKQQRPTALPRCAHPATPVEAASRPRASTRRSPAPGAGCECHPQRGAPRISSSAPGSPRTPPPARRRSRSSCRCRRVRTQPRSLAPSGPREEYDADRPWQPIGRRAAQRGARAS